MTSTIPSADLRMAHMMERPLLLSSILSHAETAFPYQEVVARQPDDTLNRMTFPDFTRRCRLVAGNLVAGLNVRPGEIVATLAWNTLEHLELYFAIPGIGAVCHTLNLRYSDQQLTDIVNQAQNRIVFVETDQLDRILRIASDCPSLETIVVMGSVPDLTVDGITLYSHASLYNADHELAEWPEFDEKAASSLCYSSGSTGRPKGALYSHRSTVLYCLSGLASGQTLITPEAVVLAAVPMFHVNGWCKAHQALIAGAKLVLPGARMSGDSLPDLLDDEGVTVAFGVPTVWLGYVEHLRQHNRYPKTLKSIGFGGGTPTVGLIKTLHEDFNLSHCTGFGMTETTTGLGAGFYDPEFDTHSETQQRIIGQKQRPFFGIEIRNSPPARAPVPHDDVASGEMECRGHFVISKYFKDDEATSDAMTTDGWFRTGDVIAIDQQGRFRVVDRLKDLIKSGGEWISSQALESAASAHPMVAEAAVIGLPHPTWSERPLLLFRPMSGAEVDPRDISSHLKHHVPGWWIPKTIVEVTAIPRASTGKIDKNRLRSDYAGYQFNDNDELVLIGHPLQD